MALKNLMARLQCRAADTPDTPDTPCFVDTRAIMKKGQTEQAGNDRAQTVALVSKAGVSSGVSSQTPVFIEPPEPPLDPNAWRELAAAYHRHHFKCPVCIAAGRGAGYGLRCGAGAALWTAYQCEF